MVEVKVEVGQIRFFEILVVEVGHINIIFGVFRGLFFFKEIFGIVRRVRIGAGVEVA